MKIAFLNIYSGINYRGAEAFSHELANRLLKKHQVVFYQAGSRSADQQSSIIQIKTRIYQPKSKIPKNVIYKFIKLLFLDKANLSVLIFTLKITPLILKNKYDVIIALNGFWQVLILKILKLFRRFKIIVCGHSGPGWDDRFNLYLKPDVFISLTKPAYLWAKKICHWTKVKLIPLAVEVKIFRTAKTVKLNLPRPIVLCPAALIPYKRLDLAIKAVSKLKSVSLLIIGKGELKSRIIKLGKLMLKKRFYQTSMPHNRIAPYYKQADVVSLPSMPQENSPMVFLEAMAAGKIVVTTDTPRNRWLLEKAGIFCQPSNINEYSQAIKKALRIKNSQKTLKSITIALEKFSWQKVMTAYEDIFASFKESKN